MTNPALQRWQQLDLRVQAVLISLLVSGVGFLFRTTPNDDAYTYIRTAEIFLAEGTGAAIAYYQWAVYPILIGIISRLFGLEPFAAAYLLDALFFALLVFAYLSVIACIDNSRRVMLLAAIAVLVYPQLNEYRQEVIRDTAFWAFMLLALWQWLLFSRDRRYQQAMGFVGSLLLAAVFRIEALAYLGCVPLMLLFDEELPLARRLRFLALFSAASALLLLLAFLALLAAGVNLWQVAVEFVSVYGVFVRDSLFPAPDRAMDIASTIFNEHAANYSAEYIALFMVTGLLAIMLANLFNAIGGPYLIILVVGACKRLLAVPRYVVRPMLTFAVINLLILSAFVLITRYLTSRYAMVLCIILSMLVPLILDRLLQQAQRLGRGKTVSGLIAFFLFYCAIDAYVSFGEDKSYVYTAADWVVANSSADTPLVTNNMTVAYESGRIRDYEVIGRNLEPQQIIDAAPGSLIAVELNYFMEQLLDERGIAGRLERVTAFPELTTPELIIFRRNTLP